MSDLDALLGEIPGGGPPAAWWFSMHPDNLAAEDRYRADMTAWRERARRLCESVDADPDRIMIFESGDRTSLSGFVPLSRKAPPPDGWRIDSKKGYLVPSRRTKADRESPAAQEFRALSVIPNRHQYIKGMPSILWLPGHLYGVQMRRATTGKAILAFCGGDPDRLEPDDRRGFEVDESMWTRLPLSAYHLLRERQDAAS